MGFLLPNYAEGSYPKRKFPAENATHFSPQNHSLYPTMLSKPYRSHLRRPHLRNRTQKHLELLAPHDCLFSTYLRPSLLAPPIGALSQNCRHSLLTQTFICRPIRVFAC